MPCRADAFPTRSRAKRRAWLLRQQGRTAEAVPCDDCGGWHINASPRTTQTTPTTTSHGGTT